MKYSFDFYSNKAVLSLQATQKQAVGRFGPQAIVCQPYSRLYYSGKSWTDNCRIEKECKFLVLNCELRGE